MMDYKYVYEVYRERSFSRAAKNLYVSQPALSATVKKIETRLGFQIFDRSTSTLELTEEGKAYVDAAEKILKIEENLSSYVNDISNLNAGKIVVAGPAFFSSFIIPSIVNRFAALHPGVTLEFMEADSVELYEKAMDNKIDLIVDSGICDPKLFTSADLFTEQILLAIPLNYPIVNRLRDYALTNEDICENKHLLPQTKGIDLTLVRDLPIILLKKDHDIYRKAKALCSERNFSPKSSIRLNQMLTAVNIASQGLGCVFISDSLIKHSHSAVNLAFFKIDTKEENLLKREVFIAYKKNCHLTRAMKSFLSVASDLFRPSVGSGARRPA
ncbi:HTH-type transcriptional regulator CynR [Caprobacter fermentans]|uniref:HTH-type transcriptional regulator CynR n=1 Tax=Caproicibacter fermentans TaxID=2576756 RepID=A0A6N8I337_9FIRM|nr:LysR family transcriptional regulator [Caproicibacter fermentans]MVB12561.1 HTH-type transcriptional regulator CynR [Caproicibacter fermentans]OCN00034.1 hypothetical protein A7X67_11780 [Clostridium sp. W14A]